MAVESIHPLLHRSIEAMQAAVADAGFEVIVATPRPWVNAPTGVEVVVCESASRGDRLDRAAEHASGDVLAFVDDRVRLTPRWAEAVRDVFADPDIVVAGGPVLPRAHSRGERISAVLMQRRLGSMPGTRATPTGPNRTVRELAGSNLIVRAPAFRAIGGFQSPAPGGEAVRLCHKLRILRGVELHFRRTLAVEATVRSFPGPFLRQAVGFGRARGDMARRLPEAAPLVPYGLPALLVLALAAEVALLPFHLFTPAKIGLLGLAAGFLIHAIISAGRGRLSDRVLGGLAMPLVTLAFGIGFIRGFFGPNLGEISPPRRTDRALRVLIFNWRDVAHPWSGGAESYLHEMGKRMVASGMEVGWVSQRHSKSHRVEVIDGIRIHRVGGRFTVYPLAALAYLLRLRKRYDVVVDGSNGIPFFTPMFSRLPRVMIVHHVHQEVFRQELPAYSRWLALWLEGRLVPRVYRHTTVVAVSKSTRDGLLEMGFAPERVEVIHNGVAPLRPPRDPVPAAQPRILCMGRLTPQKSVDVVIRALPRILEREPNTRLDIVGQGPDRTRLERLAWSLGLAHQVRFHGYLPGWVRDDLAARAWLAVCPSAREGWGLVCVEASARGLPVVAADVPGLRDAVRDGITGVLVPHGDSAVLADAIVALFHDPERREEMGEAGRQWAALHTWERSTSELVSSLNAQLSAPVAIPADLYRSTPPRSGLAFEE